MTKVAVIDYGMGNLHSVCKAFEKVGGVPKIIGSPAEVDGYSHLVLPGVGSLGDCMGGLRRSEMDTCIKEWISLDRPFLGVCLGYQALFEYSEENTTKGLEILHGQIVRFDLPHEYTIPHIGWNQVSFGETQSAMDKSLSGTSEQYYFDHSYYLKTEDQNLTWGTTHHGHEFVSAVAQGNCFGTQFHPEKSQAYGLQIYQNFLRL